MMKIKIASLHILPLLCSIAMVIILYNPLEAKETNKSLEERVAQLEALLEKKTAEYDLEISRAQAAVEIQSVMGRYAFYYSAQRMDLIKGLWAHREDASFDPMGVSMLNPAENFPGGEQTVGLFRIHALSTPVVEVAKDGQTARATWISPGIDTMPKEDGKISAEWAWIKYGCDFVKEDGEWKLLNVTAYGLIQTDFYTSWADKEAAPLYRTPPTGDMPDEKGAEAAGAGDNSIQVERVDWTYASDRLPMLDPIPPLPYDTWDEVSPGYRTWKELPSKKGK